jgi:hypothetical protein
MAHIVTVNDSNGDLVDVRWYCSDFCAKTDPKYAGWNGCHENAMFFCENCAIKVGSLEDELV